MACPGPHFSSSDALTEEGRPVPKAKKAKIKETHLLSFHDHIFHIAFYLKKVNPSTPRHKCGACPGLTLSGRFPSPPYKAGLSGVERVNSSHDLISLIFPLFLFRIILS
jgi:hypothetical protein